MNNKPPQTQFDQAVARVGQALDVDAKMAPSLDREPERGIVVTPPPASLRSFDRRTPALTHQGTNADTPQLTTIPESGPSNRNRALALATAGFLAVTGVVADRAMTHDKGSNYAPVAAAIQKNESNQTPLQTPDQPTQAEINAASPSP